MKLADKLSIVRIIFAPVFAVFYLLVTSEGAVFSWFGAHRFAVLLTLTVLLALVELTDYFDGYFARKFNETSDLGKLLDPFADALLHITAFFCFTRAGFMPAAAFLIIFYREFSMIFLRMQTIRRGIVIAARPGGKLKTVVYIFSGFWTLAVQLYQISGYELFAPVVRFKLILICVPLFYLCALLAVASFLDYIYNFVIVLNKKDKTR